ncbi:hypothetical protein [Alloactinosynnema sp. L-07]|nr:hypothetical protein [Alloactinosynnema sp. L-07]
MIAQLHPMVRTLPKHYQSAAPLNQAHSASESQTTEATS